MKWIRGLTLDHQKRCEEAKEPMCMCRCGGRLHGKSHNKFADLVQAVIDEKGEVTEEELDEIIDYLAQTEEVKP